MANYPGDANMKVEDLPKLSEAQFRLWDGSRPTFGADLHQAFELMNAADAEKIMFVFESPEGHQHFTIRNIGFPLDPKWILYGEFMPKEKGDGEPVRRFAGIPSTMDAAYALTNN